MFLQFFARNSKTFSRKTSYNFVIFNEYIMATYISIEQIFNFIYIKSTSKMSVRCFEFNLLCCFNVEKKIKG